jgi:uncharacterized sulfatase
MIFMKCAIAAMFCIVFLAMTTFAASPPNVLLIIADDLRTELGCYGVQAIKTPNIDTLAARGRRFERAYCQYSVCNPSRVSMLTGLRPDATRVLNNTTYFRTTLPDVITLPQLFRKNGYFTASLGKIFHRGQTMRDQRGDMDDPASWDVSRYYKSTPVGEKGEGRNLTGGKLEWCRWLAADGTDEDQPDGQIARDAIQLLEEHQHKPFFLAVGFHKPHDPFIAPKKYFDLYPVEKIALPQPVEGQSPASPLSFGGFKPAFDQFTDRERREFKRAYYAGASFTDAQVGRVLEALDRLHLAESTLVIFLGDHGYHLGERGWWSKSTLYEFAARAPLIIAGPGVQAAGKSSPRTVEFVDLYPTLADVCSIEPPHPLAGQSLRPLLDDPQAAWEKPARTQVQHGKIAGRSVRTERWRYTEWDDGKQGAELYDHASDEAEDHNLAADPAHAETIRKLREMLVQR